MFNLNCILFLSKFKSTKIDQHVNHYAAESLQVVFKRFFFFLHAFLFDINNFWTELLKPIDGTQIGTSTPGQSGPGSNDNKKVLHGSQIFRINHLFIFTRRTPLFREGLTGINSQSSRSDKKSTFWLLIFKIGWLFRLGRLL